MNIVDRYLARIGYSGDVRDVRPTRSTLDELLRRHVATIPFENATSFAPGPSPDGAVALDPESITTKLLGAADGGPRRGGYCFEHATLLGLVLPELGFEVRPALGRVYLAGTQVAPAKSHKVTIVRLDGRELLADPGFGGQTPTASIDLVDRGVQETPHGRYRIADIADTGVARAAAPDIDVMLQMLVGSPDGPQNLYGLDLGPVADADVSAFNWYVSTSPDSVFTTNLAGALAPEGRRLTLSNNVFRERLASGGVREQRMSAGDLAGAVDRLAIDLGPETLARIEERLRSTVGSPVG